MAILRKDKKKQFTIIDNAIFRNCDLSLKAKGLLCQMLSLPDGWEFSVEGLSKLSTDGKSAVTSALNELKEAGYFYRKEVRDGGKFGGVEYVISEAPITEKPMTENPISEKPISENQPQLNTKELSTKKSNTKRFTPPSVEEVQAYISERGYKVNAQRFVDYYSSKGWTIGRNSPMRNWQAAVRTWASNDFDKSGKDKQGSGNPWWDALQNGGF